MNVHIKGERGGLMKVKVIRWLRIHSRFKTVLAGELSNEDQGQNWLMGKRFKGMVVLGVQVGCLVPKIINLRMFPKYI